MGFSQSDVDNEVKRLGLDGSGPSKVVESRAFIDGEYVAAKSGAQFDSVNPATGKVVAKVSSCKGEDVDLAVAAARNSFESGVWSEKDPRARIEILQKFADLVEENLLELAVLDAIEAGKPVADNLEGDVPETVMGIRYHAEAIDKLYDQVCPTGPDNVGLIIREPVGVVALIVPWNFPLLMAAWKIAPALATGNSVVLKPAELSSLSAIRIAGLAKEAGIPDGVINVVPGLGAETGAALSNHMDIDMIGFTGSTLVGRLVLKAAGDSNLKRVSLECGGKSAQVVFPDVEDMDAVAEEVMSAAFWNMGENCSCGSRLLVHNSVKDALVGKLVNLSKTWTVGSPTDLKSKLGSMISKDHANKVMGFIETGKKEGAKLIVGGTKLHESTGGDFIAITIFDNVRNDMHIAQEEIFGPVLSVIGFDTEKEAIQIANDTKYGLAASLYTSNINIANRVSRKLRAGNVSVNCFSEGDCTTPFGGYKQSGFVGRDKSIFAHEQYTEMKTVWTKVER
mmetsp:Transcript_10205/g.16681  ORF Transcript_10205/g.16681 Transcript_10205/m.16681 type:complete len:509 (-) Transcript_10205:192-1718(-)|eukprot:CAMPEP_0203753678 /NCGR_PEP_ID=MMETSP0098-20131031/7402_1 /ASSEMBLY_ACC=CAM_ASM_000208 /TAXON_ID=96639 /ORGANISM=" , Strain NY0313808BC1" /LENGTH=508 /DNA_ID=CAMNT_0050644365 /DNA_START=104 /DNA_END=1630 /DNA_ORIENTATION=-